MSLEKGSSLEIVPTDSFPTVEVGTVTTLAAGSPATVTNVGTEQNAILNFAIPEGDQGLQGLTGDTGANGTNGTNAANPNFTIGTVTSLAPGSTPTASLSGTYPNLAINFGLVRGDTGSGTSWAWGDGTGTLSAQTDLQTALDAKAPLSSPTFLGNPQAPTPAPGDNDVSIATTGFVQTALAGLLNNAALTGAPTAPTPTAGDNDTSVATTAFVHTAVAGLATLDSPLFTGDARAPSPPAGDNDSSIATTSWTTTKLTDYAKLDAPALINNPKADGNFIGYRNLPTSRTVTSNVNLADSDKGKKILVTGTRTITLQPNATVAIDADAMGTIINDGTGTITLARGAGVTCKLMGSGADANRSIAAGGIATWLKTGTNSFYVGGPGVT